LVIHEEFIILAGGSHRLWALALRRCSSDQFPRVPNPVSPAE
jgi:hypothetical protein